MESHSLIWLFIDDIFHQILFYFGGGRSDGHSYLGEEARQTYTVAMGIFLLFILLVCVVFPGLG